MNEANKNTLQNLETEMATINPTISNKKSSISHSNE